MSQNALGRRSFLPLRFGSLLVLGILVQSCGSAPPAAAPCPCSEKATPQGKAVDNGVDWLIENFENPSGLSGGLWLEFDKNPLGTEANPQPFVLAEGGAPSSPGHHAHIWGKLGSNRAPWSWVQLQIMLNASQQPLDLTAYKSVRFSVKGDGGRYGIAFVKDAVKDYDEFHYEFTAPLEWTEIEVPLAELRQFGWGKPVPPIFDDVKRIQFYPPQHDKPFDLSVDHVVLTKSAKEQKPVAYDTEGWFRWGSFEPAERAGTALDVSRLLDAPAGKHGPLATDGEQFVFRDGTKARFLGVNIVASANFPTHEQAEKLAELLAQMGVNMTRHHHLDAPWSRPNIFGNKPTTLELDSEMLERFDYLIDQLQRRGIYQFFDMLVHREVSSADGVPDAGQLVRGLKIHGEFDPKLIELQERFVQQFMGHRNAYTQQTYAKDPAIALVEIINEDSLFWLQPEGEFSVRTPAAKALLNHLFSEWLNERVPGGRPALAKRWGNASLSADEDPARGNINAVVAFGKGDEKRLAPARTKDTLQFYYDTMLSYFRRIEGKLEKLGYRGLITGSNHWTDHPLDLRLNAEFKFVDRHAYWAHPEGGWGYTAGISWDPSPMVSNPGLGVVGSLARRRVRGLPYTCSEWQTAAPNDYRHEGLLLVASYASLQGSHPLQFAISHDIEKTIGQTRALDNSFDILDQPTALGAWPAAALLFHRGDVTPSPVEAFVKVAHDSLFAAEASVNAPAEIGLIARTGVDFDSGQGPDALKALVRQHTKGGVVSSVTGELRHDSAAGRFELDTPRSQGFVGFSAHQPTTLGNVTIAIDNRFAVVVVTSLDDQPISSSKHWLVTALGNAVNTGMKLAPGGNRLAEAGDAPVLVEPIRGTVTLRSLSTPSPEMRAFALDGAGMRGKAVSIRQVAGGVELPLTAEAQTMHYEIVAE